MHNVLDERAFPSQGLDVLTLSIALTAPVTSPTLAPLDSDRDSTRRGRPRLKTRREVTTPISRAPELVDSVLYEDPADPAKTFYLPRYRLGEETVSGKTQYRIALKTRGGKWALSIGLEKFPAPEIGLDARTAKELPHELEVVLTHRLFMDGAPAGVRERPLPDVETLPTGILATMGLETLEERDEVYRALTEGAYATNLEVRRKLNAAVAVPPPEGGAYTVSAGTIQLNPDDTFDVVTGTTGSRDAHLHWTPDEQIAPRPGTTLAKLGTPAFDDVAVQQLKSASHSKKPLRYSRAFGADAVVLMTPHWNPPEGRGVYEAHPLGVWFTGSAWSIFNQNMQPMPADAGFVVMPSTPGGVAFVHRTEAARQIWSDWAPLGAPAGGFQNAPAVVSRSPEVCNVYVRGGDGLLWQLAYAGGRWQGWNRHDGGVIVTEPAVDSMTPTHEHVFAQSTDGLLYTKWWVAGSGWSGWMSLGAPPGGFNGRPATISRNPQVCNVYVRGNDNALWQLAWYSNQWHPWVRHNDGILSAPPAVGSTGPDHESVFVRGTDGQVWQKWWTAAGGWSAYIALGAPPAGFTGGPSAVCRSADVCDVYVRGQDQALWERSHWGGTWHEWTRHTIGPALADDPACGAPHASYEYVFVRGADGQLWQQWWPGTEIPSNVVSNWTAIDDAGLNGKPNALCQVTQNWNPPGRSGLYNAKHIGVFYTGAKWAIYNQDRSPMPLGAAFNVRRSPQTDRSFVHRAIAQNIQGHVTYIKHPLLDGQPARKVLMTPNWNPGGSAGVYNDHPTGVYYTGAQWAIFNQDMVAMPAGAAFNVEILEDADAFVHIARAPTIAGNYTVLPPMRGGGDVSGNDVLSVLTEDEEHLAKIQVSDSGTALNARWVTYSEAPRYRDQTANLDLNRLRESFVFPPNLYGYIFRGIEDVGHGTPGLVRHSAIWRGTQHPYYQDGSRRQVFYYLPDAFKIARRSGLRRWPDIAVRVSSPDGALERTVASMGYVAAAVTDEGRLASALEQLRPLVPSDLGQIAFEPLLPTKLTFRLGLPRAGSTAVSFTEQADALVTMNSVRHSVELSIEAFRSVFDAIFSSSSLVFQGQIEATLGEGDAVPPIPFQARITDLAGDPLICTVNRTGNALSATLYNATESTVRINELAVTLMKGSEALPATVEGLTLPADIAPGQQIACGLRASSQLPVREVVEARFDLSRLEIVADKEAVWNAVLDTAVAPEDVRKVEVRTVVEMFRGPDPKVSLLRVNLKREGGPVVSVDLTETQLLDHAALRAPLRDYVLGHADGGEFQYQVVAIRGDMRTTSAFKTATSDLIITSQDLG